VQILRETAGGKRHDPTDLAKHAFRCKGLSRLLRPAASKAQV
jgi:hypothetical protein